MEKYSYVIHKAGYLLINPWQIVENGSITVQNNMIVDLSYSGCHSKFSNKSSCVASEIEIIDYGPGILIPTLTNAHTHFELSALNGKLSFNMGFNGWVRELIKQREECGIDTLRLEAKNAVISAVDTGTSLVGEISTLGITEDIFTDSDIGGVWFQEYLGELSDHCNILNINHSNSLRSSNTNYIPDKCGSIKKIAIDGQKVDNLRASKVRAIAGHAPHTTSPDLLRLLKQQTQKANLPFSIHVAESNDETEFITTGKGIWAEFLKERGIDFSLWKNSLKNSSQYKQTNYSANALAKSPVQYLEDMGLFDANTLAVHLLNVDSKDIEIIAKNKAKPVLCPRSNFNLHQKLPNIPLLLKYGLKPALGTDSLASVESINMFDEMLFVAKKFPDINPSEILAMATVNGADALGFGTVAGTIEKGKIASFIYIPLTFSLKSSTGDISNIIMRIVEHKSTK